jgi:hypothetical protein
MILKVEMLLDANEIVRPSDINALLEQVFKDNNHIAKLMVCDSQLVAEKKHDWYFYANGTFCTKCGAQMGSGQPCR